MKRILLILLLFHLWISSIKAQQQYRFSFTLADSSTGFRLNGVADLFGSDITTLGIRSDSTLKIGGGVLKVRLYAEGYIIKEELLNIKSDTLIVFSLVQAGVEIKSVKARYKKGNTGHTGFLNSIESGKLMVPLTELKKVPSIGGEPDILKAIQLTPGIKRGNEGGTGLYVRGGSNDQNLILMDDAPIYNAGHLLGFFSVFNSLALKDISVYKSGFSARYGGRLSSVIDISTKEGSMKKFMVEGSAGSLASSLSLQGPLIKNKLSFIVSGRRSYIDHVFRLIGKEMPMYFSDLNVKLHLRVNRLNTLSLSVFTGKDILNWNNSVEVKDTFSRFSKFNSLKLSSNSFMYNRALSLMMQHQSADKKLNARFSLVHSGFNYNLSVSHDENTMGVKSGIREYGMRSDFIYTFSERLKLNFGTYTAYRSFQPNNVSVTGSWQNFQQSRLTASVINTELSEYLAGEIRLAKKLRMTAGVRNSHIKVKGSANYNGPEPRINLLWQLDSVATLKLGASRMKQYVHLISGNSVSTPLDLWYPVTGKTRPELSDQITLGYYRQFRQGKINFSTELYYKSIENIIEFREGTSVLLNDRFEDDLMLGKGSAYGSEFFMHYNGKRLSGWVAYTLAWSKRQFDSINNGQPYYSKYDRRHDISFVVNYQISKGWSLSSAWVFSSGNPFTARTAQYLTFSPGQNDFITLPVYGLKNNARFSPSHRLDIDLAYKKKYKQRYDLEFHFSMYNVYNRTQPAFVEVVKNGGGDYKFRQKGLFGMIPAVSFQFKF